MTAAVELPPFEILLFIIAALIAVTNRVVEAARKARRKAAEEQRRRDQAEGVQLEDAPRQQVRPTPVLPPPPPMLRRPPTPPPLPYPAPQAPPQAPPPAPRPMLPAPPPRRHPPRLKLGQAEVVPDAALRRLAKPLPAAWGVRGSRRSVHHAAARLRQDPERLRDAIILREILGPPVALRRAGRGR